MTSPFHGMFEDLRPPRRRTTTVFDDLEPTEDNLARERMQQRIRDIEREREGDELWDRFKNRFVGSTTRMAGNVADALGADEKGQDLRDLADATERYYPDAQTISGKVAGGAGIILPYAMAAYGSGAALAGGAEAAVLGRGALAASRAAQAANAVRLEEAARRGSTLAKTAGFLRPNGASGILRRNLAGEAAAAPLITVPGALAEDPNQSLTGVLSTALGAEAPNKAVRLVGDLAFGTLAGVGLEGTVRGLGAGARTAGRVIAEPGPRRRAAQAPAELAMRQAADPSVLESLRPSLEPGLANVTTFDPGRMAGIPGVVEAPYLPPLSVEGRVSQALADWSPEQLRVVGPRIRDVPQTRGTGRPAGYSIRETVPDPTLPKTVPLGQAGQALRSTVGPALGITGLAGALSDPENREQNMALAAAGAFGIPGPGRRAAVQAIEESLPEVARATIPQEVRSVGRFGFVSLPKGAVPNLELERGHVANVMQAAEPVLMGVGASTERVVRGAGLYGGDHAPNALYHFPAEATDAEIRRAAAVRGLAYGQDQQLWYRPMRPGDVDGTAAIVATGPNGGALAPEAVEAVLQRVRHPELLGEYGGATFDGDHLLFLNLKRYTGLPDDVFSQRVTQALAEVAQQYDIQPHNSVFYAEHLDGPAAYLRTLGKDPDALRASRDALVGATPEYLRFAEQSGADVASTLARLTGRVDELDQLLAQVTAPPPRGNTKGQPLAAVARSVYATFPRLRAIRPEAQVPEMVRRLGTVVDELVQSGAIPRELAENWYQGATESQRKVAQLVLPELRTQPKFVLYTVVNSIMSSGQQVPTEARVGLHVFDQYLRTGRFSMLNPEAPGYASAYREGLKPQGDGTSLAKGLRGERISGLLGESAPGAPRTVNHELALQRLDAMVQAYGEAGAVERLLGTVRIRQGKAIKEERPALLELFGPKIGQYAMDKLGMPGGGKSTIDLWMARMDYYLRGDASGVKGGALKDAVSPLMRRRMQAVLAEYARANNIPESSAQALAWYAIKYVFGRAGAKEKAQAYATLGSATTDALLTKGRPYRGNIVQGVGSLQGERAGWSADNVLSRYTRRTGQQGSIQPTAGAFTGQVFDVGGALGAGLRDPSLRPLMGKGAVAGLGALLAQSDDDRWAATGKGMMGLAVASAAWPAVKQYARTEGGPRLVQAMRQHPMGEQTLKLLSYDYVTDPSIKAVVEAAEAEMARFRAIGQELSGKIRALSPAQRRAVSDVVEGEAFEPELATEDMQAVVAIATRVANEVAGLGQAKVDAGLISEATFRKRETSYLRRLYGLFEGADATSDRPASVSVRKFRIPGEQMRKDLSDAERLRLGEIREADYRVAETFERGGKGVATARLFRALSSMEGVIHPEYTKAVDEAVAAQGALEDLLERLPASRTGDRNNPGGWSLDEEAEFARAKRAVFLAKAKVREFPRAFERPTDGFVRLPDTPQLGSLRGAVVRQDVADYLNAVPDLRNPAMVWSQLMHAWKKIKTVYNPGTHVGNFVSNAVRTAMSELPLHLQPTYLNRAWQDLKAYGPATKFLAEQGVLERGLPIYGDLQAKGLASDKTALRALARTTRPETLAALESQGIKPMGDLELLGRRIDAKVTRAYALEDGVYRVALFQRYVDLGLAPEAAVAEVRRILPEYTTRSPILNALRNTASPFILYPAKYIPSLLNDILERPERWALLAAMWGGLDYANRQRYGSINEETDLPENQRTNPWLGYLLPGRTQVDALPRALRKDAGARGEKYTIDVARFTPLSAVTGSPVPGSLATQLGRNVPGILQPGGPLVDIGARLANTDPFTGEKWLTASDEPGDKVRKVLLEGVAGQVMPSALSFHAPRVYRDLQNDDPASAMVDALGFVGLRPQTVLPGVEARRALRTLDEAESEIMLNYRREVQRAKSDERREALRAETAAKLVRLGERKSKVAELLSKSVTP